MVAAVLMVAVVAVVVSDSGRLTNSAALSALLIDEIVRDHRASVVAASGPADIRGSDPIAVLTKLQTHGRLPESASALPKEAGQLLGGSFCRFKPTTGIRLTYRLDEGQLASFYQLRPSPAVVVPPSTAHRRYLEVLEDKQPHLILWSDQHTLYALVSEAPADELRKVVSRL
jgi:anti-sigma factor RsiW